MSSPTWRLFPSRSAFQISVSAGDHAGRCNCLVWRQEHHNPHARKIGLADLYQLDRKQQEYELIRQKQARFKAEMETLARQEEELRRDLYASDPQSEPITPPDYQEINGFPTALSRPNRFSSSSIISPPSYTTRSSRAGSQVTSPPNERDRALQALTGYPVQSVPGSRGDSDEEECDSYDGEVLNFDHKKAAT